MNNNLNEQINLIQSKGQSLFGPHFTIIKSDIPLIKKLICYFTKNQAEAEVLGLNLNKGILLTGPIGCGKTSLMELMRYFEPLQNRFFIRSCREVSFEFIRDSYDVIHKYSHRSFYNGESKVYCFDDFGLENNLKLYGNECNVMAEVLLSRYDLFISRGLITHLTTNLSASEIEQYYGNRVRSRMREQFNLIAFDKNTADKRR